MRKLLAVVFTAALSVVLLTGPAAADGGDHNCAGTVSSSLAQALGPGFGDAVSDAAQVQAVDNFGLRNCGGANGQNP